MTAMDLAVVWSPGPEPMTGLETYGGMRYIDNDFHLVVDPVAARVADLRDRNRQELLRLADRRALRACRSTITGG